MVLYLFETMELAAAPNSCQRGDSSLKMRITAWMFNKMNKNNAVLKVLLPRWRTWAVSRFTKCVNYQVKRNPHYSTNTQRETGER